MKFKIDECLSSSVKTQLETAGYDVATVPEQHLSGADDERIYSVCAAEERILVTIDHDFCQTLRFPPDAMAGIAVIECKGQLSPSMIAQRIDEFILLLRTRPLDRELWIVEPGRVRIHEKRQSAP